MTKEAGTAMLNKMLEDRILDIKTTLRLYELDEVMNRLRKNVEDEEISSDLYSYLKYVAQNQLQVILHFKILPDTGYLLENVKKRTGKTVTKIDRAEITLDELEVIDCEVMKINLVQLELLAGKKRF
ncbi:MAG: hypothetical protein L3J84_05995 [Gammaproteobacteria bacterium]|nr:hypothetical protein [Gammaproteobacteria bacterium]